MPAHFARKTMSLTHRLFGMRSCNEVITGKRGRPCLEYDIKRCIAPCVDTICSPRSTARAVERRAAVPRREERRAGRRRCERACSTPRSDERFEEAAQLRDALRTVQTLHDRQQKMATAELGHRDVFGLKLGPAGVVIQVFQVRSGRVVERVELGTEEAIVGSSEGEVLEAAIQQFYELRGAPAEIHVPAEPADREALETWLSDRAGRQVRILVPQRGEKRGFVDLANRNAALAYQTRFNQTQTAQYDALETLQHVLGAAGAAAAHRVLRHLDDSGQRDGGVDGGVRGRPHAARRLSQVPDQGRSRRARRVVADCWYGHPQAPQSPDAEVAVEPAEPPGG